MLSMAKVNGSEIHKPHPADEDRNPPGFSAVDIFLKHLKRYQIEFCHENGI